MPDSERLAGEGSREVAESQRGVTDRDCSGVLGVPNGQRGTEIRDALVQVLTGSRGKIEDDPGRDGVGAPVPGSDLRPTLESGNEASLTIPDLPSSVDPENAQRYIIGMLDDLRKQGELYRINKPRYMLLARRYGLKNAEIAIVLGMSEEAVRQAIKRAKESTPEWVI
jgi:hypothetical protein